MMHLRERGEKIKKISEKFEAEVLKHRLTNKTIQTDYHGQKFERELKESFNQVITFIKTQKISNQDIN